MRQPVIVIAVRSGSFRRRLAQAARRVFRHVHLRTVASTVELGIRLGSESPDIVVMDAALPGLDLKRFLGLMAKPHLRRTLFLCLTSAPLGRRPANLMAVRSPGGGVGLDWEKFRAALRRLV